MVATLEFPERERLRLCRRLLAEPSLHLPEFHFQSIENLLNVFVCIGIVVAVRQIADEPHFPYSLRHTALREPLKAASFLACAFFHHIWRQILVYIFNL